MEEASTPAGRPERPDPFICDIRPLLKVPQIADLLGVRPRTVYDLVQRNSLPFVFKIGGSIRARPEDLEAWIAEQAQRASE